MTNKLPYLYLQIAHDLRNQITALRRYQYGDFLPTEMELCEQYNVSRISIRKALQLLTDEGLIDRRPGRGSMIILATTSTMHDQHEQAESPTAKTLNIVVGISSAFHNYVMPYLIDSFKEKHSHIHVNIIKVPYSEYWIHCKTLANNGIEPDLYCASDSNYHQILAQQFEQFLPLQQCIEPYQHLIYPRLVQAFSKNGELMAVPVTFSPIFPIYNAELFAAENINPPNSSWTMAELLAALKNLTLDKNNDGINDQYGLTVSTALSRWLIFALQNNSFERTISADPTQLRTSLQLIQQLLHYDQSAVLHHHDLYLYTDPILHGKSAMTLASLFEILQWKYSGITFPYEIAPVQFGPIRSTLLLANIFMLPKHSPMQDEAGLFIQHALNTIFQKDMTQMFQFLSVYPATNEAILGKEQLDLMNIADPSLMHAKFLHEVVPYWQQIKKLASATQLFWSGLQTVDETIERISD